MRIIYTLFLVTICLSTTAQVVYKTTKADGTVVYSDVHSKGAVPVNLSATNSVVMPGLSVKTPSTQSNNASTKVESIDYSMSIVSPSPEQTLRDNRGSVSINAALSPTATGNYQLVMNNQVVTTQSSGLFLLENINRGAHTIKVNFLDNSGKILASSKQQTFYLHKASALINAN